MALKQFDGYGRRFYADQPVKYRVKPVHTYVRADGEWVVTKTEYAVVSDEWYRRGDEKDFDTVEHFRADTEAQCRAYMNRGAT